MDTTNQLEYENQTDNMQARVPRTYNFLLRLSRVMGYVATSSLFLQDVRLFMGNELMGPRLGRPSAIQNDKNLVDDTAEANETKAADLRKLVARSHEVLMSANTVSLFAIFPDTVTVDRTKITITKRDFFWSSDVMSIRIEDVLNVAANTGPIFGSLTIASRVMSTVDHFKINWFWRSDAIRLKHIIQGYVIAQHNKIDTTHLSKKELIDTLIELGHDSSQ